MDMVFELVCIEDGVEIGTFDFELPSVEVGTALGDDMRVVEVIDLDSGLGCGVVSIEFVV